MTPSSSRWLAASALFALIGGCANAPNPDVRAAVRGGDQRVDEQLAEAEDRTVATTVERLRAPNSINDTIDVAADLSPNSVEAQLSDIRGLVADETIEVALPPQPLPQFVDTVFGVLLEVPYSLGPGVAERSDIVSLRGAQEVSKQVFFSQVQTALKDYGLVVVADNGAIRVLESEALAQDAPLFIRSRTSPQTPQSNRPVLQFFELRSIDVNSLLSLLEETFPNQDRVTFTARQQDNTLIISGNAADVAAAARVVRQIDEPRLAGGLVARIEPVFWEAAELASALVRVLTIEGYQSVQAAAGVTRAVNVVPLPSVNQLLIFASNSEGYQRALYWVNELDAPSGVPDESSLFSYRVRNTDASEVGLVLAQAFAGGQQAQTFGADGFGVNPQQQVGPSERAANRQGSGQNAGVSFDGAVLNGGGRITVDKARNRILFQGSANEYARIRELMIDLDEPPAQALIEVTIAEVTLTDTTDFGVEFQETNPNNQVSYGRSGGLSLGSAGFNLDFIQDDVRVALNALATSSNVNVLSTPRIVARSGESARIQVGTDIPVISSQRATQFDQGGQPGTDVLQSVSYRQTGVILNVEPVIYGDNRIDLRVQQEVSSQSADAIPGISSPVISNRTIETQIALREGSTAVLGGLMQDNYDVSQRGIPFLKDLPLIGNFFRSISATGSKTELLIFVTPYIMRTDDQIAAATATYVDSINASLNYARGASYTLNPLPKTFGELRREVEAPHGATLTPATDVFTGTEEER
ncbi:MAG: secretin N-terminal domain-containing protein [Parvularcula sp.]|jgi:general secretion pathway protein D|nr:secretin N-terminal domain-containing protein [Parvularcula sp.]